jgi:hypothetical protein
MSSRILSFSNSLLVTTTRSAPKTLLTAMCPIGNNSLNSRGYGKRFSHGRGKQKSHILFNFRLSDEPEGEENPREG